RNTSQCLAHGREVLAELLHLFHGPCVDAERHHVQVHLLTGSPRLATTRAVHQTVVSSEGPGGDLSPAGERSGGATAVTDQMVDRLRTRRWGRTERAPSVPQLERPDVPLGEHQLLTVPHG